MKETIRTRLETNSREEFDQKYFTDIIDRVHEQSTLKYPPQALKEEIEEVLRSIEQDLSNQKLDLDTYLKIRKTDKDIFIETDVKPTAIKRLERSLILDEVSKSENIKVDQQQLESGFNTTLSELQTSGELPKLRRRIGDEKLANVIAMQTASRLINSQVLARLKEIATGKYIEAATDTPVVVEQTTTEPENSAINAESKANTEESPVIGESTE
jgi:trigger factor